MRVNVEEEQNETKTIKVLPWPERQDEFLESINHIDRDSLNILWSKNHFGISHRTSMFRVLYDTFLEKLTTKSTIDDELTLQTLYCDMILRLGTILEDFAGICSACREFSLHGTSIAESFLAFGDPIGFYNSVSGRGHRQIKQIFRLAQSKGNLDRIFNNLSDDERDLIWKGVGVTTEVLQDYFEQIRKTICREVTTNVTYYDVYNKLKHGFAPIYPFAMPVEYEFSNVPLETENEEVIKHYLCQGITLMHDKTAGQRTQAEAQKFNDLQLATPTITFDPVTLESVDNMKNIVDIIDYLYRKLIDIYLSYSQGSKKISLKYREGMLTQVEITQILDIIENDDRYI
jgi:hypothetical protein